MGLDNKNTANQRQNPASFIKLPQTFISMKAATVSELKKELQTRSEKDLIALCLRLS